MKRSSHAQLLDAVSNKTKILTKLYEFDNLFIAKIWPLLSCAANKYAYQRKTANWTDSDIEEIQKLLGLCLQMSQVKLAHLHYY